MLNSNYSLFMNVWPWIGLGIAITVLILKDIMVSILYHAVLYCGIFLAKEGIVQGVSQAIIMILDAVMAGYLWYIFAKKESMKVRSMV